jgi:hypothetical protein
MTVILNTGGPVEVVNIAMLFRVHFTLMKGKVFVVGLLFGVFEACGCTACKLVTL